MARPKKDDVVGWGPVEKETPAQTSHRVTKSMIDNARKGNEQQKRGK